MARVGYVQIVKDLGYTLGEPLADNLYCDTFRLKLGDGVQTFALQIWTKSDFVGNYRQVMFNDPITLVPQLDHKNVAKVIQIIDTEEEIYVILRYPRDPKSTMEAEMYYWNDARVPLFLSKKWMHGVAQGLAYLHAHGYAHRNLKTTNILIKSRSTAQISDYSLVPVANQVEPFENFEVTLRPPRIPGQIADHQKDDVWTFGVILFLLVQNERESLVVHPDPNHDPDEEWDPELYNQLLQDQEEEWQTYVFADGPHPEGAKALLMSILCVDPNMRSTTQEIANDEWLRSEEPIPTPSVDADITNSGLLAVRNPMSKLYKPLSDKLRNELKRKGIKTLNYIAKGGYGAVYRVHVTRRDHNGDYVNQIAALKICSLRSQNYREIYSVRERELIGNVHHENIIKCLDVIKDSDRHFCILMELAKGDLIGVVSEQHQSQKSRDVIEAEMRKYLYDVCKGMAHLHSVGWSHRDMKPENCLIKPDGTAVITDFSFGKQADDKHLSTTYCGTPGYQSPQICLRTPYNPLAADVWAMGCTMFACLTHGSLFDMDPAERDANKIEKILQGRTEKVLKAQLSDSALNLVYFCLSWNEADRYNMQTVVNDEFFHPLQPASGPSSGAKDGSKEVSAALGAPEKAGSKTSSGKPASLKPTAKQSNLPGPSGAQQVKGEKRKKEDSGNISSS